MARLALAGINILISLAHYVMMCDGYLPAGALSVFCAVITCYLLFEWADNCPMTKEGEGDAKDGKTK